MFYMYWWLPAVPGVAPSSGGGCRIRGVASPLPLLSFSFFVLFVCLRLLVRPVLM